MEQTEKHYPTLYKKTSTGAIQKWYVRVSDCFGTPTIINEYGQVNGKIQESREEVLEGKNEGKANETTPWEQAHLQAESRWKKQLKKGYVQNIEDAQAGIVDDIIEGGIVPMTAHKFSEQGHKIVYPALVQPKLDGHRCTSQDDGSVTLWSRGRKPIKSAPHIAKAIGANIHIYGDVCITKFDGELYNHAYHKNFEDLSSLIRQDEPMEGHENIQYHIYDFPHPTLTNKERNEILQKFKPAFDGTPLHIVETIVVNSEDELMDAFDHFIELGYEGCMIRNMSGKYVNKRSYNLQKVKEFDDDEFTIIGVKVGTKGSMAGKAVFTCLLPNKETFDAKMKGDMNELKKYADDPSLVIGKIVTVQYQGYTKYGKPRFPVALRFREDI